MYTLCCIRYFGTGWAVEISPDIGHSVMLVAWLLQGATVSIHWWRQNWNRFRLLFFIHIQANIMQAVVPLQLGIVAFINVKCFIIQIHRWIRFMIVEVAFGIFCLRRIEYISGGLVFVNRMWFSRMGLTLDGFFPLQLALFRRVPLLLIAWHGIALTRVGHACSNNLSDRVASC